MRVMKMVALLMGLMFLMAGAPGAALAGGKEVDVKVKDLQEVRLTRDGASFVLALEVKRLRGPMLKLRRGTATVKVGDTRLPPIEVDFDNLKLERGHPKVVKVPVHVSSDSARAVATDLLRGRDVDVAINGEVKAWVYYVVPISREFHAKVKDIGL